MPEMTSSPSEYHEVEVEQSHRELVKQHKQAIIKMYSLPEDTNLKILKTQQKIPDGTGLFYKFIVKDVAGRTYKVKIEKPNKSQEPML